MLKLCKVCSVELINTKNFCVGAMQVALGGAATGVFSNSSSLWKELNRAGLYSGDRVWRFPLWNYFTKQVTGW